MAGSDGPEVPGNEGREPARPPRAASSWDDWPPPPPDVPRFRAPHLTPFDAWSPAEPVAADPVPPDHAPGLLVRPDPVPPAPPAVERPFNAPLALAMGATVGAIIAAILAIALILSSGSSTDASESLGTSGGSASIAQRVIPGLVNITTIIAGGEADGTGIVLTSSGEVLTNHHVVQGASSIRVDDLGNGRSYTAKVIGYDASEDVAVIQLQGASRLATAEIGDSSGVAVGDPVTAIGNALGAGTPSVVTGSVTALNQSITASDQNGSNPEQLDGLIQTNAPLQPGDSGGPLLDQKGRVIGMNTAASAGFRFRRLGGGANESYAVPSNRAMAIVKAIEAGKSSGTVHIGESGYLGVTLASVPAGVVSGAVVAGVQAGSPAASAGIVAGDTIVSVDGHVVSSGPAVTAVMGAYHPGDRVQVKWLDRANASHEATVTLTTGPVR